MRLVNAEITLKNPRKPESDPVKLEALADTAAVHLCIPSHVQIQPQLDEIGKQGNLIHTGSIRGQNHEFPNKSSKETYLWHIRIS